MKKLVSLIIVICCAAAFAFAQADESPKKQEPFLAFDLKLAPNTNGALEGSVMLGLLWGAWFETRGTFSVTSFTSIWDENGGSTTSLESKKNIDVDVLRTRSEFLKWKFAGDDYYVAVNASALLNIAWLNKERYGYGTVPAAFTFFSNEDIFMLYPFGCGELELRIGPFKLDGYYRQSIYPLYTKVDGQFYYSTIGSAVPFSTEDRGFETRFGGTASFEIIPELEVMYGFDFLRHIGYTYGFQVGVGPSEYVYEAIEMRHRLTLTIEIFDYKLMIGAAYVDYRFNPVSAVYSIPPYTNGRVSFIFGLVYE